MIAIPVGIQETMLIVASPDYLVASGTPQTPGDLLLNHECIRARLPSGTIMRWELGLNSTVSEVDVSGRLILGITDLAAKAAATGVGSSIISKVGSARMSIDQAITHATWPSARTHTLQHHTCNAPVLLQFPATRLSFFPETTSRSTRK